MTPNEWVQQRRWLSGLGLILIVSVGAFFRLYRLGLAAFRADTMEFWRVCHQTISVGMLWKQWLEVMGRTAQFPFPLVFTKGFLDGLGLAPTDFTIRLPSALWGVATIPFAYLAGAALGRRRFGLVLALLYALNPLHIQISREAYFYAPLHLGTVILLWSTAWTLRNVGRPAAFPIRFYLLTALGFFLTCYSQLAGWWFAALVVPWVIVLTVWRALRARKHWRDVATLSALFGGLGAPLLFFPWGVPYFYYDATHPEIKEQTVRASVHIARRAFTEVAWEVGTVMGWGRTALRIGFLLLVVVAGLALLAFARRRKIEGLSLYLLVGGWLLYYVGYVWTGTMFSVRHAAFVLPAFLTFVGLGLFRISALPVFRRTCPPLARRGVAYALLTVALALWIGPAWAVTQVEGKPTPYKKLVRSLDELLPHGTPVLVDRWYEPWNELRVHASTNVSFTFTVPNEPLDVFKQVNWRQTAVDFFRKYPDAAYLEIAKSYFEVPEIGFWNWPREYFARHVVITDPAGLQLRRWGLAMRDDYYSANTNRLVVELFYNTPDDVLARARAEGRQVVALYGPGWRYSKPFLALNGTDPRYRDAWLPLAQAGFQDYFSDWRVVEDVAGLDIVNLTASNLSVEVRLKALAAPRSKQIIFSTGERVIFDAGRLMEKAIAVTNLPPGATRIRLADSLWPAARVPLFVADVQSRVAGQSERP